MSCTGRSIWDGLMLLRAHWKSHGIHKKHAFVPVNLILQPQRGITTNVILLFYLYYLNTPHLTVGSSRNYKIKSVTFALSYVTEQL